MRSLESGISISPEANSGQNQAQVRLELPYTVWDAQKGSVVTKEQAPEGNIQPILRFLEQGPRYTSVDAATLVEPRAVVEPQITHERRPLSKLRKTATAVSMALLGGI